MLDLSAFVPAYADTDIIITVCLVFLLFILVAEDYDLLVLTDQADQ
jgi:hypothetical protein